MTNIFDDPNTDYASELIGEGKKYADIKLAAKALVDKDSFIEKLQRENAEMRKSLSTEEKMELLLDQLKKLQNPSGGNANTGEHNSLESNPNQNPKTQTEALTVDAVQKLLDERESKRNEEQNLALAVQKAKEAYGANAKSVIEAKAAELGMSFDDLIHEAKKRPQAFLKLIEANGPKTTVASPKTQVNTVSLKDVNGNVKNNAYYAKLRKEVGNAKFFTPAIQNEMERMAKELGDAFWN